MNNVDTNIDMRTPLAKAMGAGSAHSGTGHFWQQRITALFNIPLCLFLLCVFMSCVGKGFTVVHHIFSSPIIALFSVLAILSGIYHMKIGLQVIIEDYVPHHILRAVFLALNAFFCYALIIASMLAILKINFGG